MLGDEMIDEATRKMALVIAGKGRAAGMAAHRPLRSTPPESAEHGRAHRMARLAQTAGLTEIQQEILATVRRRSWTRRSSRTPRRSSTPTSYPQEIVDGMKEMGLFGLTIPEEYGGLGESLLTYALVVEQIARGWMSVSGVINTHFIVAYMIIQHGTEEQKQRYLPQMATGEMRGSFSMSEPDLGSDVAAIKTKARAGRRRLRHRRREDVADQRRHLEPDRGAGAHRRGRGEALPEPDHASWWRSPSGFGEVAPGLIVPGKIDKMGYKGVDTTEMVFNGFRVPADAGPGRQARRRASRR